MRKFNYFILSLLLLPSFSMYAEGDGNSGDSGKTSIPPPKDKGGRPKAPANRNVLCGIEDGVLTILFREPEGHASVEIKDLTTGFSLSFEFESASGFRYALPPTPTHYQVTVRTELNNTYIFENIEIN